MTPDAGGHDRWRELRGELERLDRRGALRCAREWRAAALGAALRSFAALPAGVAALYGLLQLAGRLLEWPALRLGVLWWLGAGLGLLALAVAEHLRQARAAAAAAAAAGRGLSRFDHELGLHDRLRNAQEFLRGQPRTAFMEAAIEDAEAMLARARAAELEQRAATGAGARPWYAAALAVTLYAAGAWLGRWTVEPIEHEAAIAAPPLAGATSVETPPEGATPEPTQVPEPERPSRAEPASEREATSEPHASSLEVEEDTKESQGRTGSGRSSAAESASGASSARGVPSQQGQISKPGKQKATDRESERKKEAAPIDQQPSRNDEQDSGATAGRGSSRGSNRNPAASDWSSKDHVATPDDEELEDEDDVDDEQEEQESRGGMQPNLRDRKPPTSRDLTIGFGNRPNPDADGRGGPSEQKKSRGTASLVLGVPIPDRVKGQPNPGKTKITQERVEPRAEPADPVTAEPRRARAEPTVPLRREEMAPWLRRVVREYFLAQRRLESTSS